MISIYRYLSTNRQNEPPKTDVNMFISEFSKDLKGFEDFLRFELI